MTTADLQAELTRLIAAIDEVKQSAMNLGSDADWNDWVPYQKASFALSRFILDHRDHITIKYDFTGKMILGGYDDLGKAPKK